jgi:hypothetical protein
MMPSCRRLLAAGLAALVLSACQTSAPRPAVQPVDFSSYGPILLSAGAIDVVDSFRALGGNHVEGRSPFPPAEAVRRWAATRLQAAGGPGRVRVIIKDASIVEVALPRTGGVQGYFTNDQAQRYDGRLEVEITGEIPGEAFFRGRTQAVESYSVSVPENISLADREATFLEISNRLIQGLNARLDAGIRKDLAPMVRR